MRISRALAVLVLGLGLALVGCGDDQADSQGSNAGSDHNDADVAFASDMIQHHAQALAMVDMTVGRELDPALADLVEAIRMAQGPEIERMTDWLVDWGEPVPATVRDHVNAEGHGGEGDHGGHAETEDGDDTGTDMPGMMSEEDMAALGAASDTAFPDMFLTMMIEHHEGAIEMAQEAREDGRFPAAVELAAQIEASQTAEIETMREMLG